ncbi:MAG: T9SS type A sorting domain-containing protein [Bacteroidota bacterium]
MKKTFLVSIAFLLFSFSSFSQNEKNIWYFGDNAGLDFNSGSPVALTNNAMATIDNSATVADKSTGSLLFYSNGLSVWNRNHTVMPNGSGLQGNISGGTCAFAVKQPGSNSLYYLFTTDYLNGAKGLEYSVIDMSLNSGDGDVTAVKNVMLLNPATERMCATYHANGLDIWVIAHPYGSGSYNAYLLTSSGLNTTPVVSTIGTSMSGNTTLACGQMTVAPKGNKICSAIYNTQYELYDFNCNTGVLSNCIIIPSTYAWGCAFSPNGVYLYTSRLWNTPITQYNISSNNQATIIASETVVGNVTGPDPYYTGYMQNAPDDKIYIAKYSDDYLAAINSPDVSGVSCNFSDNGIYLGGRTSKCGLPNFVAPGGTTAINDNVENFSIEVYPNPAGDLIYINTSVQLLNPEITIFNQLGQVVLQQPFSLSDPQINISNLTKGIYILQLTSENKTARYKIIK